MADEAAAGVAAYNARLQGLREDAAAQARIKIYGPMAGDPDAALKSQQYEYNVLADPLKIQGAQQELEGGAIKNKQAALDLSNAQGQAAREAGFRALSALNAAAGADGSVNAAAYDRILTPEMLQLMGVDPDHAKVLRSAVTAPGGAAHLQTIEQALLAPSPVTGAPTVVKNPDGSYAFAGRNRYGQIAEQNLPPGTTPVVAAAAETRANSQAENANTSAFRANTSANNSANGSPNGLLTGVAGTTEGVPPANGAPPIATAPAAPPQPTQNVPSTTGLTGGVPNATLDKKIADAGGNIDAAIAATSGKGPAGDRLAKALADRYTAVQAASHPAAATQPASAFDRLPTGSKARGETIAVAQQIANQHTTLNNMHTILDSLTPMLSPYTTGVGAWGDVIPASEALNVKENLDALKSMGFMTALAGMKNSKGQTGIGRILQSEVPMLQKMYGSLEQKQSVPQLLFHLKLFRQAVDQTFDHTRGAFKAQWGTSPEGVLGLNDDGSSPSAGGGAAKPGTPATAPSMTYDPKTGLIK